MITPILHASENAVARRKGRDGEFKNITNNAGNLSRCGFIRDVGLGGAALGTMTMEESAQAQPASCSVPVRSPLP